MVIDMKSILFVCHGNICRSVMAEFILKYLTNNEYRIESRATSYDEIGNDIYPNAKEVLSKNNIPFTKHSAGRITIDDYKNFDLIVAFDEYNIENIKRITGDLSKVIKLNDKDVDDPWYTRDFDKAYNEIYSGCVNLLERLDS